MSLRAAPLADAILVHAARTPRRTALAFEGSAMSWLSLAQAVDSARQELLELGVRQGDRVAWLGLNSPRAIELLLALSQLGAVLVPLNYRLAPAELQAILDHAQAWVLLTDTAHEAMAKHLTPYQKADDDGIPSVNESDEADPPVLLVYTSGTTGQPKGALHTQAGLLANCAMSHDAHAFTPDDHVLTVLPLFHVGGLCIQTLPALHAGARVTLHARFEARAWLRDVQALRPTMSLLVPATLRAVLAEPEFARADLSSLRLLNAGSSTVPLSMIEAFHARAVPVCQVYGATETGPVSIYLKKADAMARPGSAGRAGQGVSVRLVDVAGADVSSGRVGEIWLRAPNLMRGYWRDPGNPSFQGGWFHTGDLARVDTDGFYWVVGRSKDMIISGGENIYPAELENILADCPWIEECAVVGQADERWGETVVAVVVRRQGSNHGNADVLALFDGKLARFKHPRRVVFATALPKTALGKVRKDEVTAKLL